MMYNMYNMYYPGGGATESRIYSVYFRVEKVHLRKAVIMSGV